MPLNSNSKNIKTIKKSIFVQKI